MAAKSILVTGGCRSGKSGFAQELALKCSTSQAFIATCPLVDEEMNERIRRHQRDRQSQGWRTIEEPIDLPAAIRTARDKEVVLIDCLTLWISNILLEAEERGAQVSE